MDRCLFCFSKIYFCAILQVTLLCGANAVFTTRSLGKQIVRHMTASISQLTSCPNHLTLVSQLVCLLFLLRLAAQAKTQC